VHEAERHHGCYRDPGVFPDLLGQSDSVRLDCRNRLLCQRLTVDSREQFVKLRLEFA
jgi:hypothetical protein